ncbi:alkene reductase [Microbacterium flavum]|uniref:Alkene reductase n=1 Tax=Microbacterium flavum TaxID=415216 RepID=A0ABS5XTJ0_9MICO|nr:alkene reductase [Microbacterium flavum]MBT8797848.1 alkene reductase [Microbacterium flavum]
MASPTDPAARPSGPKGTHGTSKLWTPTRLGDIQVDNRLAMSPMTRRRADADGQPNARMATYYAQRASFGLIVTEGTYPSVEGRAYPNQPGILASHAPGWAHVTDTMHQAGGRIAMQLMHAGRLTHPDITGVEDVVAPSAIGFEADAEHAHAAARNPVPRAATKADLEQIIHAHVTAAQRAIAAGFDGIELHSANGYLLQQFLSPATNQRTDTYGGSPAGRARFIIELVEAIAGTVGAGRVGLRLSPGANIQGADENDPRDLIATYTALGHALRPLSLAYVSIIHPDIPGELVQHIRHEFSAPLIANTGFGAVTSRDEALRLIDTGAADLVAIGRPAIANPDLPARWTADAPEALPDPATFYTGERGYTDYPTMSAPGDD